eukprot:CAMPEP_0119292742 /NCGR_PEP_ID=MMETSP1329-20130426/44759_1 /TAXON_ID=114041 /ORGANISM="Genus nov. species nov., Strain RCC1024" /LENGTH=271 /DNA_ID=CAMNT_0007293587 /DNA_START=111 /DNA_END=922 /DNA_ORIENTATION=-
MAAHGSLLWFLLTNAAALVPPSARTRARRTRLNADHYLGIDLSTQSCTAVVVDASLDVVHRASVNFDAAFPWYGTAGGFHATAGGVATAPVALWLDGLDKVLDELPKSLKQEVAGISVSGQQHGSVYWAAGADALLARGFEPDEPVAAERLTKHAPAGAEAKRGLQGGLREALCPGALALADSPIWADASTQPQCDALEAAMGGPAAVAEATGSRAYARFTGHQMAKVAEADAGAWAATARVSLVSSFGPSVLCGRVAPVDASDSTGTNVG